MISTRIREAPAQWWGFYERARGAWQARSWRESAALLCAQPAGWPRAGCEAPNGGWRHDVRPIPGVGSSAPCTMAAMRWSCLQRVMTVRLSVAPTCRELVCMVIEVHTRLDSPLLAGVHQRECQFPECFVQCRACNPKRRWHDGRCKTRLPGSSWACYTAYSQQRRHCFPLVHHYCPSGADKAERVGPVKSCLLQERKQCETALSGVQKKHESHMPAPVVLACASALNIKGML